MYTIWVFATIAVLFWTALGFYIGWTDHRYLASASAVNSRGDRAIAETQRNGNAGLHTTTVIKLKQADHWFATDLLRAESDDYLVGFKWRDNDTLTLTLDFGCNVQMTPPAERVGPITVVYRFGDPGGVPPHGYSSLTRNEPRKPCS